jgi:hypothetical protein
LDNKVVDTSIDQVSLLRREILKIMKQNSQKGLIAGGHRYEMGQIVDKTLKDFIISTQRSNKNQF